MKTPGRISGEIFFSHCSNRSVGVAATFSSICGTVVTGKCDDVGHLLETALNIED